MAIPILILLLIILLLFIMKNKENYSNQILNIYGQPLKVCGTASMSSGSWDSEGKCSEKGGGVHQICIKNIASSTKKFSLKTGQSDWSDQRGKDNHCVCLGAWSLYNSDNKSVRNKKVLKCDAIPAISLSQDYVSKFSEGWNKWNGLELKDQIIHGVEALFLNCYEPKLKKSEVLKKNYCEFAKKNKSLQTPLYKKHCN